ncbi:MAG: hypothetical protein K9L30_13680 [Desulfobacterales bacterium]|nr:hypothetical protein [Desulfobacterales bacterium]
MIVFNNAFVYIHHPKTGGTFVTEMLRKIALGDDGINILELPELKHAGIKKIPSLSRNLPIVTNVRNVFEHYVSRYTFRWWADPVYSKKMFDMDKVLKIYPDFPDLTFSEFLHLFNKWSLRGTIPEKKAKALTTRKIGYNSWVLTRLTNDNPRKLLSELDTIDDDILNQKFKNIHFLKTENLNSDLFGLLQHYGIKDEKTRPILDALPILPQKGGRGKRKMTWNKYFSEDDIKFILERDRLYFRLFPDMVP